MKEFIKKHDGNVSGWDFNLGCPSRLSKKLSHGAFMHKDFENIRDILKTIRASTKKPVMVKLRKSPQALKIAKIAEEHCDAVGIHARTSQEGYSGIADYNFALKLKDSIKIPVIYSGNVSEENIEKILKDFDYVFIGRASIGNPNIFSKILKNKKNSEFSDYLKLAKKYDLHFRQIKYQAMLFTKGNSKAKELRRKIISAKCIADLEYQQIKTTSTSNSYEKIN
jgi:tRNA-dihydrouridine synthase